MPAVIRLAPVLGIKDAAPLCCEFINQRGRSVVLDASQVSRLGGQCLQVLIAARHAWDHDGAAFSITDPSSDFTDALALLGAGDLLEPIPAKG